MSKHTPGPWEESYGMIGRLIEDDAWCHIADVADDDSLNHRRDRPFPLGTGAANARLITAAPDMLEALKKIAAVNYVDDGEFMQAVAEAAIAKAEGRE